MLTTFPYNNNNDSNNSIIVVVVIMVITTSFTSFTVIKMHSFIFYKLK